jgi:hypothetical protein
MNPSNATLSRSSPKGGKRGCLCKDGNSYSIKCCDGTLQAQGIGNISGIAAPIMIPYYWGISNTTVNANQIITLITSGQANVVNQYPNGQIELAWLAQGKFLWFAYQSIYPNKTRWFNTILNQGHIGGVGDLFGQPTQFNLITPNYSQVFKFYVSQYATTTSGTMLLLEE